MEKRLRLARHIRLARLPSQTNRLQILPFCGTIPKSVLVICSLYRPNPKDFNCLTWVTVSGNCCGAVSGVSCASHSCCRCKFTNAMDYQMQVESQAFSRLNRSQGAQPCDPSYQPCVWLSPVLRPSRWTRW